MAGPVCGPAGERRPQRISLSLTASYAPAWGLWEGVRELLQNWHDGLLSAQEAASAPLEFAEADAACGTRFDASRGGREVGWCEYFAEGRTLVLVNRDVGLGRQVLLLGYSKKAQHQDVIGSFGEGLKVGAVALLRRGLRLRMLTRAEAWSFELAVDPAFGERVLTVEAAGRLEALDVELEGLPTALAGLSLSDTATVLEGVGPHEWAQLSQRFLFLQPPQDAVRTEVGRLLLEARHVGDFFVRGVWINQDPDLAAGVDLFDIRLDRDRAAVLKKTDLQHQVSSMWVRAVHHRPDLQERYYELLAADKQSSDTAFADLYCDEDAAEVIVATFMQRHGSAIPVSLKDSNSTKVQQIRSALSTSTVVCSQALLAVLKKGGVRCDLDDLLQESDLQARRFISIAELSDDEAACLAQACNFTELALPSVVNLLTKVDVYESPMAWSPEGISARAEAFALGGRVEIDRRALDCTAVHNLLPEGSCFCAPVGLQLCWCRQSLLACSIHIARAVDPRFGMPRLMAKLGARLAVGDEQAREAVIRCPDLGKEREEELRTQIRALERTLSDERNSHAAGLRSLQRRVAEAERELRETEFKFMDVADAERALREQWEPELARLQQAATQLEGAREEAATSAKQALDNAREAAFLRRRCGELAQKQAEVEEAASRRVAIGERSAADLRRALARRRELLQKMLLKDVATPLIALADSNEFLAAVEEIRTALREEAHSSQCCVCTDAAVNAVLLPCRHQQLCMICAAALSDCPVCRTPIETRMQVYAS